MVRNWLKRVLDTLTDMELDDELKLRVATRLIDKSVVTWWDNLKLRSIALVSSINGITLYKNLMNSIILTFTKIRKDNSSSNLSNLGSQ